MKRSKKYKKAEKLIDTKKRYSFDEALDLLPQVSTSTFNGSVELHLNLILPPKQKKEGIRGSLTFPHQIGESPKVVVITTAEHMQDAKGADLVGEDDLIAKIEGGWTDFDIVIATPEVMPKLAKLGRVLGPKGKMPNPKNETVTTNLKKVITSYKKGKITFKSDPQGSIHQVVGKLSMKKDQLRENITIFLETISRETKGIQGEMVKSVFLSPTMGPSIRLDMTHLTAVT